jgi:transcriptional regulator with XRE-family HTH domain
MNDRSYTNWHNMSDQALAEDIGAFVKQQRLEQDFSQEALAKAAGISRSTLSLLEQGKPITLATLLQVLRVLDQLQFMEYFIIQQNLSPLALAKLQKQKRQRASSK